MTWRAFILGVISVAVIAWITPINDYEFGNTFVTGYHFPPGAFFLLMLLTLVVNVVVRLVRRAWGLRQAELMLIWCMMLVSCTVPASGLMRFWFSMMSAPAYYAQRPDMPHMKRALEKVPAGLVVAKDEKSIVVRRFYEGLPPGETRVAIYLRHWIKPMLTWGIFIIFFYFATFFLCGVLRKQWVESERLIFPLARVPLELTEGCDGQRLLPSLLYNKAFLVGATLTFVFGVIRAAPALLGGPGATGWQPVFNVQSVLWGTPVEKLSMGSAYVYPLAIGVAFLVPADVALSVWFFFLFSRVELQLSNTLGVPIQGGTYGPFMAWQQAGAFVVFTMMMIWMARRHLTAVFRKAMGQDPAVDDTDEPIGYAVGFWGLVISAAALMAWYLWFGLSLFAAAGMLGLILCILVCHARLIAQGGVFFVQQTWSPPQILHSITGGKIFGAGEAATAAIVASMQHSIITSDAREILSAHAMNALRVSSVFKKRRRLFLPIMMIALLVALTVASWSTLRVYNKIGAVSSSNDFGIYRLPNSTFQFADQVINNPEQAVEPHYYAMAMGAVIMFFVTVMRARFYWWPIHSLGFLVASTWVMHNLWFPFLIGWLAKVIVMKFCGGGTLRGARYFFLGVIIGECVVIGMSTLLGLGGIRIGNIFLPV